MRWWDGLAWTEHISLPPPLPYAPPPLTTQTVLPGYAAMPSGYPAQLAYASNPGPVTTRDRSVEWLIPVGRTGLSIGAGYAGLVALLCFYFAPIALVLGVLALRGLRDSPLGGRGRAWFATIVGGLGTLLLAVLIVMSVGR
jgi:hypothetical protein